MTNNTQFSGFQPLRPPLVGSADPPQSSIQPVPVQSWSTVPLQQPQQFLSRVPQHFQSGSNVTPLMNMGMPSVPQHAQFAPLVQHLPLRPVQSIHNTLPPPPVSLPPVSLPVSQPNNPIVSESLLPSPLVTNTFMPPMGTPVTPLPSSSFTFASQGGQQQMNFVVPRPSPSQYYPISRPHPSSASTGEQVNLLSESVNTVSVGTLQHTSEQPSVSAVVAPGMSVQRNFSGAVQTDWIEHTSANGKRYYYNKKTKLSSWEKPLELMTAIELADASTNWKEITSSDGRIYYYNKVTKQSKWEMPEELKSARQQVNDSSPTGTQSESLSVSSTSVAAISTPNGTHVPSSIAQESASSPVSVTPTDASGNKEAAVVTESATLPNVVSAAAPVAVGLDASLDDAEQSIASRGTNEAASNMIEIDQGQSTTQDIPCSSDEASVQEIKKDEVTAEKPDKFIHEKLLNSEPVLYASKLEAKNAFKALLENASVGSDWTWERAMRVIINDKRYGALKTLGEKKEAFNEFVAQRRKQEAEEKRSQQKKARENFRQMLEGCQELTSSSRWSKVETWFEGDERFKAIERDRDRKDLFENFIHDLEIKEREKALEERKKNIREYRQFLESCDFIKASSQWRKLQDRLEADERCMRLEKIDRLEIFQEYLRDLEKEEEEQKKIQKEEMRKVERKNRDEFRKLLEEHVAAGTLTAKTHWRDYYMMVRDVPAYLAVASNTVGSTPKDLFEDVAEELKKQYDEDKSLIEDAVKLRKVCLMSSWTVEDLKASIADDVHCPPTSEINFKLVFDELLERAKKKEEKEAKKRKRLGDKFFDLLLSAREITPSSNWEDCRQLVESSYEYSSIADDSYCKEIFEEYITKLKDHEKRKYKEEKTEREREKHGKERKRVKARREKERHVREEESRDDVADANLSEIHLSSKKRKSGKDRERKHLKQHHSTEENIEIAERDCWEKSCRHVDDYGKATEVQDASTPESDCENQHKNHKKDDRNFSHKNGGYEELEDGEFGEDGRSW